MSDKITMCEVKSYVSIDKLKNHETNPRMISGDRMRDLKLSIVNKGFYEPVLVWSKDNIVLSGNHRVLAARQLIDEGYTFVAPNGKKNVLPVVVEDVAPEVAEAILYDTNNSYADWVEEKLQAALLEAQGAGKNLRDFGFTDQAIGDLLKTALKDCESLAEKEPAGYEPKEEETESDEEGEEKPASPTLEAWLLPAELHGRVLSAFTKIAEHLSPHRGPNEPLYPAVEAFCVAVEEDLSAVVENIRR